VLALLFPAIARAQNAAEPAAAPGASDSSLEAAASVPADYRLDIGDQIRVHVRRHDDVNGHYLVPADGKILLPRLEAPIGVRGKTCAEVAEALAQGWKRQFHLLPGQITVSVAAQRQRRVYVRGNAIKTGDYDLRPEWRVSHLLAIAGMPTVPAERVTALVLNERRPSPVAIDLDAALNVPDSPENVPLLEGDTLLVNAPRTIRLLIQGEGPRGEYEIDHRYGLRLALTKLSFSTNNATGALGEARIIRKAVAGDLNSPDEIVAVDLRQVMTTEGQDVPLRDMDLLYIPPTKRQVYLFGTIGAQGRHNLPEDRPSYLKDVLAMGGMINGASSIGNIRILRVVDGKPTFITADYGRYLKTLEPKDNPEILPQDIVYVENVKRTDVGSIWTGVGLWQLFRTIMAGGLGF
jgi:protein involved in polysaccharide export with SLBB domain